MSEGRSPQAPSWLTLDQGESMLLRSAPSKNLLLAGLAGGMLLLVGLSVVVSAIGDIATGRIISFAGLLVFGGILAGIYLFVNHWTYVVTSERVCVARTLRSSRTDEVRLEEVGDISMQQSWWQRIVDVGDLQFTTNSETLRFDSVENPHVVYERMLALVESNQHSPARGREQQDLASFE